MSRYLLDYSTYIILETERTSGQKRFWFLKHFHLSYYDYSQTEETKTGKGNICLYLPIFETCISETRDIFVRRSGMFGVGVR